MLLNSVHISLDSEYILLQLPAHNPADDGAQKDNDTGSQHDLRVVNFLAAQLFVVVQSIGPFVF